jgi:hypothetical protein
VNLILFLIFIPPALDKLFGSATPIRTRRARARTHGVRISPAHPMLRSSLNSRPNGYFTHEAGSGFMPVRGPHSSPIGPPKPNHPTSPPWPHLHGAGLHLCPIFSLDSCWCWTPCMPHFFGRATCHRFPANLINLAISRSISQLLDQYLVLSFNYYGRREAGFVFLW